MLATGRRGSRRRPREENGSYWMSYSDMMAALLMMFVLLLFLSFNRYMTLQETKEAELAAKETQLSEQEAVLAQTQADLQRFEEELLTMRVVLSTQEGQLNEQQLELDYKTGQLATSKEELEQSLAQLILQQQRIEDQEALLALSKEEVEATREQLSLLEKDLNERQVLLNAKDVALLAEQLRVTDLETLLNAQKDQLDTQTSRIDELVGVRSRIIEQLRDAFASTGLNVSVDRNTGAITMASTVFFDTDQTYLKPEGREVLGRLLPIYFGILMSPENEEYVGEIIIEGHTDSDGTYEHNLDLSQRRAQAVVSYCMSEDFTGLSGTDKSQLRQMITANGRSWSQPVLDAYGQEDKAASRRVEIKFRLKDAEMIDDLSRILSEMGTEY